MKHWVVVGLVFVVVIVGGYWVWERYDDKASQYGQPMHDRPLNKGSARGDNLTFDELFQDVPATETVIPDTFGWQEYENKNIGFKTKLPEGWIGQAGNISGCLGTVNNEYGIEPEGIGYDCPIQIDKYSQSEKEVIEIIKSIKKDHKFSKIEISKSKKFLYFSEDDIINIYFKNGNKCWYVIISGNEASIDELMKVFNGIIREFANTK